MGGKERGTVTLKYGGSAVTRNSRGTWSVVGRWDYSWENGRYRFRGRMGHQGEWSPWMLKRELREWFGNQVATPSSPASGDSKA